MDSMQQDDRDTKESPVHNPRSTKSQRLLACVLCQQRKIKCDRNIPCANCVKARTECVPVNSLQRRRKPRFPERELLERVRKYEDLLRQHNIPFEPLHRDSARERESGHALNKSEPHHEYEGAESPSSHSGTARTEGAHEAKNIWHAMNQSYRDPDDDSDSSGDNVRQSAIKKAFEQSHDVDESVLLFGTNRPDVDISTLHPDPAQIFKFWQVFLDNANPLLKVIHAPSMQSRIIEAVSNIRSLAPPLEALLFSVYLMAVHTLETAECETAFGSSKEDLQSHFQFGCQQALFRAEFLQVNDRDTLVALFLYLVTIRPSARPNSVSSLLGIAVRMAQRMGINNESYLAKLTPLEAEMSRRLWWSLAYFDTRVSEMSDAKFVTLNPTWDCAIPLNVNDADLRLDMRTAPLFQARSSDAIFLVVRAEVGEFLRHSHFHLGFNRPALKPLARQTQDDATELSKLANRMEEQYFQYMDEGNPVHFTTIWMVRTQLARYRLFEHLARHASTGARQTDSQLDFSTSQALTMLECDARMMSSPLTKGLRWLNFSYFPFPAYIQTLQDLRARPSSSLVLRAWEVMSNNYEAWFFNPPAENTVFRKLFSRLVMQAWNACNTSFKQRGETLSVPSIVVFASDVDTAKVEHKHGNPQVGVDVDMGSGEYTVPLAGGATNVSPLRNEGVHGAAPGLYQDLNDFMLPPGSIDAYLSHFDWNSLGAQQSW